MMKQYRGQRSAMGNSCPVSDFKDKSVGVATAHTADGGMVEGDNLKANSSFSQFGCVSAGSYKDFPLAIVFPPAQSYGNLYSPMEGLENGTLFADLKMPFHGNFKI